MVRVNFAEVCGGDRDWRQWRGWTRSFVQLLVYCVTSLLCTRIMVYGIDTYLENKAQRYSVSQPCLNSVMNINKILFDEESGARFNL